MENINFKIIACNPKNNLLFDKEDSKLSEAIYTIFPMENEDAILIWGDEKILLSYRYDISEMIDDIMQMFFALQKSDSGEWFVDWTSNTFASNWKFRWLKNCLEIEVDWREEFNATNYLKKNNVLKIDKDIFLNEWRKITKVIQVNLKECGYSCECLKDMMLLNEINNSLM